MLKNTVRRWITDECWSAMGPALEAAKHSKAGKPSLQGDRDFLEALIWEARTGSPWRDMPTELGRWHNVYMRFRRWEAAGVWQRFWAGLQQEALDEATALFVDSTTVRAHQHAAGAPKKNANNSALGRSRGGLTTKIHEATLNENRAVVIQLTPGQASDCAQFEPLYQALPEENLITSAALDKGYDTNAIRARLSLDGIEPVIPGRSNRIEPIMLIRLRDKATTRCYFLVMDPRGFPTNLPEFQRVFPDNAACAKYLEAVRWPGGFVCPACGIKGEPYRFQTRTAVVLRCRGCKKNASLTAGTIIQSSHTPLATWFWGAYLMTTQTPGQSALQFQRQLGLTRYETAFQILHKLRAGMVRPERDSIGGENPVEIDECYVGGATRGEGHGTHHKTTVVGAVEVRTRKDAEDRAAKWKDAHEGGIPTKKLVYAGRLRLKVVSGKGADNLTSFIKENVAAGSTIRTDGWQGYNDLPEMGYSHDSLVLGGDPDKAESHLPMIHLVFSNLKTWILGTHHGRIAPHHLQAYLNEYVFRFNRRFYPMTAFNSVLGLAARALPPTYAQLYSGEWVHPAT